jgi:voltage-gated sodium channel type II alpha
MEPEQIIKSPSDFSCHSYELFVGQEKGNEDNNKEKMSIRSEGLDSVSEITRTTAPTALASAKARKVSTVSMFLNALHAIFTSLCLIYYQIHQIFQQ